MAIDDAIIQDLTPGMTLTIKGAAKRYGVAYSTAQRALRNLWRQDFVTRHRPKGGLRREFMYEGKQDRLL